MILIGYWNEKGKNNYIDPNLLIDKNWELEDRDKIVSYLKGGKFYEGYMGFSWCRVCNCCNGATELTDGVFYWPEGLVHYVEEHHVILPSEFVEHMRAADFNPIAKMNIFQSLPENFWELWCKGRNG